MDGEQQLGRRFPFLHSEATEYAVTADETILVNNFVKNKCTNARLVCSKQCISQIITPLPPHQQAAVIDSIAVLPT